jgi:membrane associated rhomboid family serine protease
VAFLTAEVLGTAICAVQVGAVANVQRGGIAYVAHLSGFTFGAIAGRPFERFLRSDEWGT